MNLAACDGTWTQDSNGYVQCSGTLQIVAGGGPFGLPPITYGDANLILGSVLALWALVWCVRQMRRVIR